MMNPPRPQSKPETVAKGIRTLLQGRAFEAGVLTGIALSLLAKVLFGS